MNKTCIACRKKIRGFSYHCEAENLDLHPGCYKLDTKVIFYDKIFKLRQKMSSACAADCDNNPVQDGWSYVSSCDKVHFHVGYLVEKMHDLYTKQDIEEVMY